MKCDICGSVHTVEAETPLQQPQEPWVCESCAQSKSTASISSDAESDSRQSRKLTGYGIGLGGVVLAILVLLRFAAEVQKREAANAFEEIRPQLQQLLDKDKNDTVVTPTAEDNTPAAEVEAEPQVYTLPDNTITVSFPAGWVIKGAATDNINVLKKAVIYDGKENFATIIIYRYDSKSDLGVMISSSHWKNVESTLRGNGARLTYSYSTFLGSREARIMTGTANLLNQETSVAFMTFVYKKYAYVLYGQTVGDDHWKSSSIKNILASFQRTTLNG